MPSSIDEPTLYQRRIRELVGHGECLMGILDSYPHPYALLPAADCEALERAAVSWRWKLRERAHRLSRVHGDFHPWNLLFEDGLEFSVLDRSRGEWGEPADDVAALGINYLFYGLLKSDGRDVAEPFLSLFGRFLSVYLASSGDSEILEVLPPFLMFRAVVIAHPRWYPDLTEPTRRALLDFARTMAEADAFDPERVKAELGSADVSWAVWVTGPPGSGKTTVARAAAEILHARGEPVRVLELDAIRSRLVPDPEYSETERELVYRSLGYMTAQLTQAGVPVIVDATAHRRRWRELARAAIERFAEVQILCPLDVCRERERTRAKARPRPASMRARADPGRRCPVSTWPMSRRLPRSSPSTRRAATWRRRRRLSPPSLERLAAGTPAGRMGVTRWAIWITGRPGSGKTTLARRIAELLATEPVPITVLDLASARRFVVGREWATDRQEEVVHRTLALTAQLLTEAGVAVILDATAPRRAWRELGREWIGHFAEVQLVCPADICAARERATRWHLGGARFDDAGPGTAAPDIAIDYEESLSPELRLHTHAPDLRISVEEVLQLARRLERTAIARATDTERSIT